ncbi:IS3 family transposase, partial [Vibrio anguillarum]|uniref:IS3 family transposase n=1 Tax=Vibrio anguillarum TaxID=55601 RepID=UPI00188AB3CF
LTFKLKRPVGSWGAYEAIQYEPIMTRDEMRQTLFEYIEVDYNRTRRHSALGYLSPVNFENKNVA